MKRNRFPLFKFLNYVSLFAFLTIGTVAITRGQTKADGAAAPAVSPLEYRIGAGDVLDVNVWKDKDASATKVLVRSDGKVTLPLVKEVNVEGQTPADLEKVLTERFAKFIPGAEVTVVVTEVNSKKIYLLGAVKKEGGIPLHGPTTVLQALAEGGGMTEFAKRKKIFILRGAAPNQTKLMFNYNAVIKGEHPEQNILLQPGDTIVVPQ